MRPGKDTPDGLLLPPPGPCLTEKTMHVCYWLGHQSLTYVLSLSKLSLVTVLCLKMIPNCAIVFQTVKADNW